MSELKSHWFHHARIDKWNWKISFFLWFFITIHKRYIACGNVFQMTMMLTILWGNPRREFVHRKQSEFIFITKIHKLLFYFSFRSFTIWKNLCFFFSLAMAVVGLECINYIILDCVQCVIVFFFSASKNFPFSLLIFSAFNMSIHMNAIV